MFDVEVDHMINHLIKLHCYVVVGLVSLALVGGCSSSGMLNHSSDQRPPGMSCKEPPISTATPGESDLALTLSKSVAEPGDVITLAIVPTDVKGIRGPDSFLECWDGDKWVPLFVLISGDSPETLPVQQDQVIPDIGFSLTLPEQVKVPDTIPAGLYRITKNVIFDGKHSRTLHEGLNVIQKQDNG